MLKQEIKMLIDSEGFTKALGNKKIFFTLEGNRRLGLNADVEHSEIQHPSTQENELIAKR